MRLLQIDPDGELSLVDRAANKIQRYAILSHTWGPNAEEVTFQEFLNGTGKNKPGYAKIKWCGEQAKRDGLNYFWVDTCSINKESSQELSEAINSMFLWYKRAERCYVYLADVTKARSYEEDDRDQRWKPAFRASLWFTRGWTLQELVAPTTVEFFSKEGSYLGNKRTLEQTIHEITNICVEALRGRSLHTFSTEERFSWAKGRITTRDEDGAYSLLGIFDVQMPLLYAEGREKAFHRLKKEITDQNERNACSLNRDQKRILIGSLRFDQIDARQATIKIAHAKTCSWLLKKSEFLNWLDPVLAKEHHGFLWIKGKPGAGKSTLMRFVFMHARASMKDKTIISFFFNARGDSLEKSTAGAYRSLLLQLLERIPKLDAIFESINTGTGFLLDSNHQWTIEELKVLLEQAVQSLEGTPLVCFIDALDECDEDQVRDMVSFFERLGELSVSNNISLQICFSSRHYPHITIKRGVDLVLEGQAGHRQDITNYLESELKIGKSKIAQDIRTELQERASGVFMWVVLVVSILNKEHDRGRIHALRRRLNEIPNDLSQLFRDILTRDLQDKDELILCIQWILFAKHPLSAAQLYFAILSGIEPDVAIEWNLDTVSYDDIKRFILNSSKGLAEIASSESQQVQFIHESVRDFLLKENGLGNLWPDLKHNFQGRSHEKLKQCCLTAITQTFSDSLKIPIDETLIHAPGQRYPFLGYAVQHVLFHADIAQQQEMSQKEFLMNFDFSNWIRLNNLFTKDQKCKHKESVPPLYVLAEFDRAHLIELNSFIPACLEEVNERYGCALFAALATGSRATAKLFRRALALCPETKDRLQELGIPPNYTACVHEPGVGFEFRRETGVFSYAVQFGDDIAVAYILGFKQPALIRPPLLVDEDQWLRTMLRGATKEGYGTITKLLLDAERRGDLIFPTDCREGILCEAASYGREEVVKFLLDAHWSNKQRLNFLQGSPLSSAVENGHEGLVRLLLATGQCDINWRNKHGRTALHNAASLGKEGIVKLLLGTGQCDVNIQDTVSSHTALSLAIACGQDRAVKLLLDTNQCDLPMNSSQNRSILLSAAKHEQGGILEELLRRLPCGIDVRDANGRTSLMWAVFREEEVAVRRILKLSADVDCIDRDGRTAVSMAAESGNEIILKLLVDAGAAMLNFRDKNGLTPLLYAARNGHAGATKVLIDTKRVDINAKDQRSRTPLAYAAISRSTLTVRNLLQAENVDINSRDLLGRTPLALAVHCPGTSGTDHSILNTVREFIRFDHTDFDARDRDGCTALWLAVWQNFTVTVGLLLATGKVDIYLADKHGKTPFSLAKDLGYIKMIALLESGSNGTKKSPVDHRLSTAGERSF